MQKILLHSCCAPCSVFPLKLLSGVYETIGLWYNPNIYPYAEWKRRRDWYSYLTQKHGIKTIFVDENSSLAQKLGNTIKINSINWKPGDCESCYKIRLSKTLQVAQDLGIANFTTTLLGSPYQKYEKLVEICEELGEKYGIKFINQNFRQGFWEGKEEAKSQGIYVQPYCGCVKSIEELKTRRKAKMESK